MINTIRSELDFCTLLQHLCEANLNQQASDSYAIARDMMPPSVYARECQTVQINIGRQTGKTTCLLKLPAAHDVIFAYGYHQTRALDDVAKCPVFCGFVENTRKLRPKVDVDTVWIDEASYLKPEALSAIYAMYGGIAQQFVLLG